MINKKICQRQKIQQGIYFPHLFFKAFSATLSPKVQNQPHSLSFMHDRYFKFLSLPNLSICYLKEFQIVCDTPNLVKAPEWKE